MNEYKAVKINQHDAEKELAFQRRNLRRLRAEAGTGLDADRASGYMEFARLAIICAKRGYMCMI